ERLLNCWPEQGNQKRYVIVFSKSGGTSHSHRSSAVAVLPRAYGPSVARVLWRVAVGVPFSDLSQDDRRAYASFVWARTWNLSMILICAHPTPPYELTRGLRRRLLSVLDLLQENPKGAIRRLVSIGLSLPELVLKAGGHPKGAGLVGSLAATIYVHLHESGAAAPE